MAGTLNKVVLLGNLAKDPEVRYGPDGGKIVTFSLATSEQWRDKTSGERKERAEFHRIVIFNEKLAEVAERYLKKGRKVYLEGQIQSRKWTDQSGVEKYVTEIVLQRYRGEIILCDSRGAEGGHGADDALGSSEAFASVPFESHGAGNKGAKALDDFDDEIPF